MTGRSTRPPRAASKARPALAAGLTAVSLTAVSLATVSLATVSLGAASAGPAAAAWAAAPPRQAPAPGGHPAGCVLGHPGVPGDTIKHVIYIQFDNTHYTRDDPSVPSDLEQLPSLLRFLTGNGTLISHEHTPLIAHTADDIVTSESGLYGSDQGMPIANEYNYYVPGGATHTAGSFAYWTDPIVDYDTGLAGTPAGDSSPTLIDASGRNTPAPWVPYTRAGCDFGTVAGADTELENTLPDVPLVFGANSPEAKEAENPKLQDKAAADFEGLAVHCARGSAVCARGGRPDLLPDEPGGYPGYQALYGSKFVQPVISPAGPVRNLDGVVMKDSSGDVGFPGYDGMTGPNALAYTLDMQLHGVPVTDTYLSDLHDSWTTGTPFGPGQAGYERQLRAENAAFGTFFRRLAAHGISKANTLFVVTADEGDHFVGSAPAPAGCNGVTVPCHYSKIGEVNGNLTGMLGAAGVHTPFDVAADSAPALYVHGQPARTAAPVRTLERKLARLREPDLVSGKNVRLTDYLADPVELKLLHMVTADPRRTPSLVLFGNDNFWLSGGPASCGASCVSEPAGTDAWNHGDVAAQINTTWLGMAGPGVAHLGVDNSTWSDHTDIQPTMMELLGLHDDYVPDGRVLAEVLNPAGLPPALRANRATLLRLGQVYTQLEAAVGRFGLDTLRASTRALASTSPGDRTYHAIENQLQRLGTARDAVAGRIRAMLDGAAFGDRPVSVPQAQALIRQGDDVLAAAAHLASHPGGA